MNTISNANNTYNPHTVLELGVRINAMRQSGYLQTVFLDELESSGGIEVSTRLAEKTARILGFSDEDMQVIDLHEHDEYDANHEQALINAIQWARVDLKVAGFIEVEDGFTISTGKHLEDETYRFSALTPYEVKKHNKTIKAAALKVVVAFFKTTKASMSPGVLTAFRERKDSIIGRVCQGIPVSTAVDVEVSHAIHGK